jgi:hypothetical protein
MMLSIVHNQSFTTCTKCNQGIRQLSECESLSSWTSTSRGACEFANSFGGEAGDLFDYMIADGLTAQNAADLIKEMTNRVITGKLATNYTTDMSIPATPSALLGRSEFI